MGLSNIFPFAKPALKHVIGVLLSFNDSELQEFGEGLGRIAAPISRRSFKKVAQQLAPKMPRVSESDLTEALALVCQVVRDTDILEPIEEVSEVPEADRARLEPLFKTFNANRSLAKAIALDRLLDRGPRIQNLSWDCDLRWPLQGSVDQKDEQETRVPLAIFRLKVDDWNWPIYFQLAENELEELIGDLQQARTQLQKLSQGER
jgi:hypothetical protein